MPYTALLFDLDGTLVHTDPLHLLVWQEVLSEEGVDINEIFYRQRMSGRHNPDIVADVLPHLKPSEGAAFIDAKEAQFRERAASLKPLAGLERVLDWAKERGIALGLVTNAPKENAEAMLGVLGLSETFEVRVGPDDVTTPKPDPEMYRLALTRLGVEPKDALVFEDSPSGVRAARSAGLQVVGVATTQAHDALLELGASHAIDDFTDVELWRRLEE